jgi:hypothetical protein
MSPITALTLVPVIMWLGHSPLEPPTDAQAASIAALAYALIQDIRAAIRAAVTGWLAYRKGTP